MRRLPGKENSIPAHRKGKLPPPLSPGDTVSLVAPAGPFNPALFRKAVLWLRARGYRVRFQKDIFSRQGYLAGDDRRRSGELSRSLKDASRAVFAARGGYGSMRLFERGFRAPRTRKLVMGMSDLTVLLNEISKKSGVVTVHGPVLAGDLFWSLTPKKRDSVFSKLERGARQELRAGRDYAVLRPGSAQGKLRGGNLAMVAATLGTPLEIPFSGSILFLEDLNEPPYRVDRMFAQLALSGKLKKIRGLVLGDFTGPRGKPHTRRFLLEIVRRYAGKIPVLSGVKAGHFHADVLLPIGGAVRIGPGGKKLVLSPLVAKNRKR